MSEKLFLELIYIVNSQFLLNLKIKNNLFFSTFLENDCIILV